MFLHHRRMLLLLPLFALCFAAPPSNYGTSVKLEGISTEKNGLSATYQTSSEMDDCVATLQEFFGDNINDSEVGGNGSDSTNNATEVDHVTSNSTSLLYELCAEAEKILLNRKKEALLQKRVVTAVFFLLAFCLLCVMYYCRSNRNSSTGG
uniref:Transmembrane protein n=1 Tax=Globodera rostochiensis TaxID=31243 RepID=A0A914IC68_GLORO